MRLEWGELATRLGLSRSMLDMVRKGQRNLSFKALDRLEQAERDAGILPSPPAAHAPVSAPETSSMKKHKISEKGEGKGGGERERLLTAIGKIEAGLAEMRKILEE